MIYSQAQLTANKVQQEMFLLNVDYHSGTVGVIRIRRGRSLSDVFSVLFEHNLYDATKSKC